ncbi:hypothetical protein BU24DRAFT_458448 [Aaosphaeria arxii CBS 175.79]|uniref:Zn(2)-C6 fungal-type domain-containing protein n=1 Tax=Aaosphaeria arxii CBS 175.79 TaxID=1450172 RepID=A0A6A5Y2A4_9PLEO|nr:uncharacterized protein BU24DRAFT_458448 [Aaosphaeria arxii CBS 175.79]KAF2018704.1 hypothetical protein BU24DRAFT_458448 [Aaosphaeria arxii CBS 175.79]
MADQSTQQSRPNSYPSPHSYPSPSMQPTYTYPPPQLGQANPEPYRGSPQGSNMSLPPLNLPPIRGLQDGQSQQPPQPQHGQQPMGSPLPPPPHGMAQYYPHGHAPPPGQSMPMAGGLHQIRYPLPPQADQRILSGGRHKKEIKRRTKTGCLTCRKRRIKCDEGHPTCRNCQKSKRECLGYDPIFKQQPGPATIQPAPNAAPHHSPVQASAPPSTAAYAGQVPQGYAPAASAGYAPPPASGSGHPHENFGGSAIDPALAADPNMHGGQAPYNGAHALNPVLRGLNSPNQYPGGPEAPLTKAKRIRINDVFAIAHHPPPDVPPRATPITPELDEELKTIFANDYCLGLDAVLETKWFSTNSNALTKILADKHLHEEAIHFVETVKYRSQSADMGSIFSQEARLIWHMLGVCKQAPPTTNGTNGTTPPSSENEDVSLKEVRARFDILEALLTNQNLPANPVRQIPYGPDIPELKKTEITFWEELGNFVVNADNESAPAGAVEYALGTMRNVLSSLEVRDAIYSIAIARHLGNRIHGFPNSLPSVIDQNPESEINKLTVAMSFISYECRNGSQQVVARICDMAMLSWTVSRSS